MMNDPMYLARELELQKLWPVAIFRRLRSALSRFWSFVQWSIDYYLQLLGRTPVFLPALASPFPPAEVLAEASEEAMAPPDRRIFLQEQLILDQDEGAISFVHGGEEILEGFASSVTYEVAGQPGALSTAGPGIIYHVRDSEATLTRKDEHLQLTWHLSFGERVEAWLEVRSVTDVPVQIDQLRVLESVGGGGSRLNLGAAPRRWSVYQHGWNSWSPAFGRHLSGSMHVVPDDERYAAMHLPHGSPDEQGIMSSEWVTVLWGRGGTARRCGARGLLLGFVSGADQLAEVRVDADADTFRGLRAVCHADHTTLEPGGALRSERLMIDVGEDPLSLLESYADRVGALMGARTIRPVPTGWCTWYYFFGEGGEKEVQENLAELRREKLPLEYVLVDDGYQSAIGDWLTLDAVKYSDMAALANAIHEGGQRAGIWLAPFGLDASSKTYAAHPDWVVQDEAGHPVIAWQHAGRDVHALDVTHPDVEPWLSDTLRTMREDWGYDLFKIDFLFAASVAGRRYDPAVTRAQALRRGLRIIREAAGEEAFLLGCGAPQIPCVGLVDAMRVGPDVAANWHPSRADLSMPSAENALRNAITRYFAHGRLWINDPDCVLVRDRDDRSDLVLNEMRSLVGIIALLGGATISGDNLPSLRKGRFKYLQQMLPPSGLSARPLDLLENEMPQCLVLRVSREWGEWMVVGAINWQDRTLTSEVDLRALGLPAGRYHAFSYWPRRYLGVTDRVVTIERHQPHETVILLLKKVTNEPDLLTTTFHVAQTLSEVESVTRSSAENGVRLMISLNRPGNQFGELWFTHPSTLKVKAARIDGHKRKVVSDGIGIGHLGLSLDGPAKVELEFVPIGEGAQPMGEVAAGDEVDEELIG